MAEEEKQCEWNFGNEGGIDLGPNDPIHQTFKGSPIYSIVREAIQNSMDAVFNPELPVEVSFQYFKIDRKSFPNFFAISNHINQSISYFEGNKDAEKLLSKMMEYLNGKEIGLIKNSIVFLKISDYNTQGMSFKEGNTKSSFYAFLRAAGVSSKNSEGAGGSFGFGKGAYFALSPIKTIIVSSKDIDHNVFFEGSTRLTTHKNLKGEKLSAYGFYDNNSGNPVVNIDKIPEIFSRNQIGTDVNIMGLWEEEGRKDLMIKSVLNNFWLAILKEKLIVKIEDCLINKDTIIQYIDKYFPNDIENGNANDIESWNPKSYFKSVKHSGISEQFRCFEDDLKILGKVKLYVYLNKDLPNRTSFFRSPNMVVFKKTDNIINGYSAVFICENPKGNNILKQMENPSHNEWKKENYPLDEGKVNRLAKDAEAEFKEFVKSKLSSLSRINSGNKLSILGLEDYLSIPEDLLEKFNEFDISGENKNDTTGSETNDITPEETGGLTTINKEPLVINPTINIHNNSTKTGNFEIDENGDNEVVTGGKNNSDGGDKIGSNQGDSQFEGTENNQDSGPRKLITTKLKVAAQLEDNVLYHHLIINSTEAFTNCILEIFVGDDNDGENNVRITFSNSGRIISNKIIGVNLNRGINTYKIRFEDDLKHSIKIKAYEYQ